jgi:hypothetical protein
MTDDQERPERPRAEPEIIPPDRSGRGGDWSRPPWRGGPFGDTRGTQRIRVMRLGPFGVALLILAIAAILAIILIAALGFVLIWIPIVAMLVVIAAVFRFFRR